MEYKTRISKLQEEHTIRGEKLSTLVQKNSFSYNIFFLVLGRKPSEAEATLFDKMLSCVIDHGMGTTSSQTARFIASGGNEVNVAVGGALLSIGDYHGGAIKNAMSQFYAWEKSQNVQELVEEMITHKKTLFGFGHKHYKKGDPRVAALKEEMKRLGFESRFSKYLDIVEAAFVKVKGRAILANIDGMIAALLCDFGADPKLGKGFFLIGRTPGLVAQTIEELTHEKPVRRVPEGQIEYTEE